MKNITLVLVITILMVPSLSLAHPGRTDSSGCHTCKTNCPNWGLSANEYHCHKAKALPQPKEPIKSTYGEQGTGYTTPAPEYKIPATTKKVVPKKTEVKNTTVTPENKVQATQEIKTEVSAPAPTPIQSVEPVKKRSWLWNLIFGF